MDFLPAVASVKKTHTHTKQISNTKSGNKLDLALYSFIAMRELERLDDPGGYMQHLLPLKPPHCAKLCVSYDVQNTQRSSLHTINQVIFKRHC
jgi:hypothetical protein